MNIGKDTWQDYRGKGEGMLVHLDTTRKHALPVHDAAAGEPHYETGTYGFLSCSNAKTRLATFKNKRRYFLFGTRYQGQLEAARGKFLIIGYMRLDRALEVRKRHVHKWMENQAGGPQPECMDMDQCFAFASDEMNVYAPEDGFELSEALMRGWGYKGKITKQMKLTFAEDKLQAILDHFKGKAPRNAEYIAAIRELERATEEAKAAAAESAQEW